MSKKKKLILLLFIIFTIITTNLLELKYSNDNFQKDIINIKQ